MIIERFNLKAQEVLERASRFAVKREHRFLTPWHLLWSLLSEGSPLRGALGAAGVDLRLLGIRVDAFLLAQPKAQAGDATTPINRSLERVFVMADELSHASEDKYIGPQHLLLGLLEDKEVGSAVAEVGGARDKVTQAVRSMPTAKAAPAAAKAAGKGEPQPATGPSQEGGSTEGGYLEQFTTDLTEKARSGKIDPVIGRHAEIKLAIEILSRRMKNNPIVIGEPGVGKTAIVEGLAQRIATGQVPEDLKKMRLMCLDLGSLIAGAKFRGEFEERIQKLLAEVMEAGNIILFIDEIHMLIGAGGAEGSMDAANLLKPALARGQLRCIGATTLAEYKKRIEKDPALMRRFQIVMAPEPTVEETLAMLRGVKGKYELHHGVRVLDEALTAAVRFSRRYIADRFLPDKAFDVLDQTAATVRIALSSKPEPIENLERRRLALEIEKNALATEPGAKAEARRAEVDKELAAVQAEHEGLFGAWERERKAIAEVQDARKKLEEAEREREEKLAAQDFARVAELEYKVIPDAKKTLEQFADVDVDGKKKLLDEAIGETQVAAAISRLTGIPVAKMVGSERERLLQLEDHLRKRVCGQEQAIGVVARSVRRARAGVQNPKRPIGSFLMLGPTGVGKTELAKTLAEFLFDDERALVRFDMSEFMEKHAVSTLVGAPPGYIGYDEGGVLTNRVRRRPYSVLLFDEVEKGHNDVYNLFLQLLDDGRLTDSQGTTVDFSNTIVMLTSNLGAEFIRPTETPEQHAEMMGQIMGAVRSKFRPEFINRLDDMIFFQPLTMDVMAPIVDIQLARLAKILEDKSMKIDVKPAARQKLAEEGYNPAMGARPLQRVIQTRLQDPLAQHILEGNLGDGDTVLVDVEEGEFVLDKLGGSA